MELELQKERFECYCPGAAMVTMREESAETIVPDHDPDISRIVETSACLHLRSRTVQDGKLMTAGIVRLTLLYLAEDTQGLRSLEYAIPFEQSDILPDGCDRASTECKICGVEARLLNPRKLFTHVEIEWRITPYCRSTWNICTSIPEQKHYALETRTEKQTVSLICAISEKNFVFSDEITLPGGQETVGELLCSRVKLRVTEVKSIGSKVILKGIACLSLLYAAENGRLCSHNEELPFSQIIDGVSEEESKEISASAVLNLTGCEIHTGDGNEHIVDVKLFLNAFIVLRHDETVSCITDLYSTAYALDAQVDPIEFCGEPEFSTVTQSVREQFETGTDVKCVLDADVRFGAAGIRREGGKVFLHAPANVTILYQDESDTPLSLQRRIEVEVVSDMDEIAQVSVNGVCTGDISSSIGASGIELRFSAEFTVCTVRTRFCECLVSLNVSEHEAANTEMPSLVLRLLGEGESLWDVAKQYRTTVEEILSANDLSDGTAESGQMLLIPRKR